jgi:ABC-type oligopeptide transport system substrate-binding subunit
MEEESTRVESLIAGSIDMTGYLEGPSFDVVEQSDDAQLVVQEAGHWYTYAMDMSQEPFTDPRVVEAYIGGANHV